MARNRQADPNATVKYLIKVARAEDFIIEIPAHWKVTFSSVNPTTQSHGGDAHCVRVWEGEKLRAVYGNIVGFRDLSIPTMRKVTREAGESTWVDDGMGTFERATKVNRSSEFVSDAVELPAADDPDTVTF